MRPSPACDRRAALAARRGLPRRAAGSSVGEEPARARVGARAPACAVRPRLRREQALRRAGRVDTWPGRAQRQQLGRTPSRPSALSARALASSSPSALGHRAREEDADRARVAHRPVVGHARPAPRTRPAGRRVGAHVGDPGVDAVAVGLEARLELGRQLVELLSSSAARVEVPARDQVVVEVAPAEDLRQAALGGAAEELELEEPVLGDRVAGAPPGVVRRSGRVIAGTPYSSRVIVTPGAASPSSPRLVEQRVLEAEADEQLGLVVEVRRAGAGRRRRRPRRSRSGRAAARCPRAAARRRPPREGGGESIDTTTPATRRLIAAAKVRGGRNDVA